MMYIELVENYLSYNISKLRENRSIITEIQSIFHKYADVIICKFVF